MRKTIFAEPKTAKRLNAIRLMGLFSALLCIALNGFPFLCCDERKDTSYGDITIHHVPSEIRAEEKSFDFLGKLHSIDFVIFRHL